MSDNLLKQIWERRSLIILFALNDVKLRYKNSVLGFLWSFLEPLLMLAVLYIIFTNIIKSGIENYPLYLLLGLIIWYMFQRATSLGQSSLLERAGILQKVYFRREIVVISSCLTAFIMMGFEIIALSVFMVAFHFVPSITIMFLPLLLIDLFILSVGISLFLSVLTVYFRDVRFIWQVLLQVGIFVNPIIYQLNMFPDNIRSILELNPLVSILNAAHDIVLYGTLPTFQSFLYIIASTGIIFIIGYIVFRSKEKEIVEKL
ncbi:MAG TPA: ABC transporter permease [Candidatus Acidoferrales bacterium]|nr:ABC transporter permease [Candidatus Acidoferrales bacterium]